jgi:hypothetical protein
MGKCGNHTCCVHEVKHPITKIVGRYTVPLTYIHSNEHFLPRYSAHPHLLNDGSSQY